MNVGLLYRSLLASSIVFPPLLCLSGPVLLGGLPSAQGSRVHARPLPAPAPPRFVQRGLGLERTLGQGLPLAPGDLFGSSVAPLGDFDGNGTPDLVVTAPGDVDGGAVWLLFLERTGSVIGHQEISDTMGGFSGDLAGCGCTFTSADRIGDLDGDGVPDLIVGSPDDLGDSPGSAWVLFLNADGTVKGHVRITENLGGFVGAPEEYFGFAVTGLGDLDGDGHVDALVGGGYSTWILFLNADGTVRDQRLLVPGANGFPAPANWLSIFGWAVEGLGDFDGDGVVDAAVSAQEFIFEGQLGMVYLVRLNADGTVKATSSISSGDLGFWPLPTCGVWYGDNWFGLGLASLGDLDHDGVGDLGVGAPLSGPDGCCEDAGGVWILNLNADGSVRASRELTLASPPWDLDIHPLDRFGHGLAVPGDLDHDGRFELAVGAPYSRGIPDCDLGFVDGPRGSVRLLFRVP